MEPLRVGLTGGLAAGKSTVADWLRRAGYTVVDADELVRKLYEAEGDGAAAVTRLFGSSLLTEEGSVDAQLLAQRIFSDPAARRRLESVIHPLVRRDFETLARSSDRVTVLEAPLLVEAGFAPDFDLVVTVEATPETRVERAIARGLSPEDARRRLDAQTDPQTRIAAADRVLRNDGTLEELRSQVEVLIAEIETRTRCGS